MSTLEWTQQADDCLRLYAPTCSQTTLLSMLRTEGNGGHITQRELVARCKQLGVKIGALGSSTPEGVLRHFSALPSTHERHEWDGGLTYRIPLNSQKHGGLLGITVHTQRGHTETLNPRYRAELVGGEDSGNPVAKRIRKPRKR